MDKNLSGNEIIVEPSPIKSVVKKVAGSLICAFIFIKFTPVYPIKATKGIIFHFFLLQINCFFLLFIR